MSCYTTSTQKINWHFSPEKLAEIHAETVAKLSQSKGGHPIKVEDWAIFRLYYEQQIIMLCNLLHYDGETVAATAVVFLKRFFLNPLAGINFIMGNESFSSVVLACIFIACKAEERYVSLSNMVKSLERLDGLNADVEEILKAEVTVLQAIRFQLKVYSPYRSLCGFVEAVKRGIPIGDHRRMDEVHKEAKLLVQKSLLQDSVFTAHPGSIAFVALRMAAQELDKIETIDDYIQTKFSAEQMQQLTQDFSDLTTIENSLNENISEVQSSQFRKVEATLR